MTTLDQLHRYVFNEANVRGELVRLDESLQAILQSNTYPKPLQSLLAELATATCLLAATIKFTGEISVQIQAKGAMNYAVINATHDLTMRGVARWDESLSNLPDTFSELVSEGVLIITITPDEGERYQGMVALDKPSLSECLEGYFTQSEQLATKVVMFSDIEDVAMAKAAGFLLQVLPTSAEATSQNDNFEHLATLTETMSVEEVLSLPVEDVLYRLYHQEDVELYPAAPVIFKCTCSREKSAHALRNVEKEELLAIVAEDGDIKMNCQYCHAEYRFDAIDVEAIHSGHFGHNSSAQ